MPAYLNQAQIKQYQDDGFVVLPELFTAKQRQNLIDAAAQIVSAFDIEQHRTVFSTKDNDKGRDRYFMDSAEAVHCFLEADALDSEGNLLTDKSQAINKIGHAMHDQIPAFGAFCRLPLFKQLLHDLGYMAPQVWQTMYIFKQPQIGGEVRWHQDASYLHTEPAKVAGLWVALEDAGINNGCLWVEPGGHRSPLREIYQVDQHGHGVLTPLNDTPWPDQNRAIPVEVAAGSLIVFTDHLPHYSSHNYSNRSRQAFSLHIADSAAHWSKRNWLQRKTLAPFRL